MDENNTEASGGNVTGDEAIPGTGAGGVSQQDKGKLNWEAYAPQPTVLSLQDLADLPKQILPEPTYRHLKNAGIEAWLAVTTLFESLSETVNGMGRGGSGSGENKARRHINVE